MELEHSYIETNEIRLHVVQAGPKSGAPVMLLHGFPEFWYGWRKQIPALVAAGYRVIAPDQRGYNLSAKPKDKEAYRVSALVDDVLGLIAALGYEKINLVGHDWGGGVAWTLAATHPQKLHKLAILNSPHPTVYRRFLRRDPDQIRRSWYWLFFQLPRLAEAALSADEYRALVRSLRGSSGGSQLTQEEMRQYKEAWSQPGALTAMLNWYRAAFQSPPAMLPDEHIAVRTLMMWGVKDPALTHRLARLSMDYCDDGNLIFFPESTHWVQHDSADEVNHYLIDFLQDSITRRVMK
ncbi:MAG: alpha/beta hydrolase [Anaerolineaceae bacterium]|jgi:pimeloyl-ACP methyl ester carboxylesterase|nr:alpha/beta hydrolase [Anaerolineaceae bacterium]OQY88954.1 MAG: alpha/beta hydrolase [Anaerolineae bacterium UTCFX1]